VNQQINLYQPIFRRQKAIFSALAMVQVWGIVVLMMVCITAYTTVRLSSLEKQLKEAQKYQAQTQRNVDQLKAQELGRTPSKLLESEVKRTQAELEERRQVAALLSGGALSNTRGFSAHFEGLARHHAAGSWLTEISLREGGNWINLRGVALAPEVVPVYLQNLLSAEAFAGLAFNVVNLQAAADDPGRILFEVGTAEKEPGGSIEKLPKAVARPPISQGNDNAVVGITRRTN
jgi:hypothetical protein